MTMQHQSYTITADGYRLLRDELEYLSSIGRRQVADQVRDAREDGNLADNPGLLDLLTQQAALETRIAQLSEQLEGAQIAPPVTDGSIGVGNYVTVRDVATDELEQYQLVAEIESDATAGKLSVEAPIGSALFGLGIGDVAEIDVPRGSLQLEVVNVDTRPPR